MNRNQKSDSNALLFINGEMPKVLPKIIGYDFIACTDGALHYLEKLNFPLEKLDFISGDMDSFPHFNSILLEKIIPTPDQNFTDFHKALEILVQKGIKKVDVFGASGKEQDHFLGNLNTSFIFQKKLDIVFYDEYSQYFFIPNEIVLSQVKGENISLFPFPEALHITTTGLQWNLNKENLHILGRIGTRNLAIDDLVTIQYASGKLLLFIGNSVQFSN